MPLFGKHKPETPSNTPSREQVAAAASRYATMRGLWLNGRIDLAILGPTNEAEVFVFMPDLYDAWLRVAAQAWRGYETHGRGFLLFNTGTRQLNYYTLEPGPVPAWLPGEIAHYCASYDPRTELVLALYGITEAGVPDASAALWVRPPDTWITPPAASRQWEQTHPSGG
jgi:hypothetical protein